MERIIRERAVKMKVSTQVVPEGEAKIMKTVATQMGLTLVETPAGETFEHFSRGGQKRNLATIEPGKVGVRIEYPAGPKGLTEFWQKVEKAKQEK